MMNDGVGKRKYLQQKQALHNAIISIPFFISKIPTKIIAINQNIPNHHLQPPQTQQKMHFQHHKFIKTKLFFFQITEQATQYHLHYSNYIKENHLPKNWIQYCLDISEMENILYFYGKMYVGSIQNRELKGLINDISQLTVVNGAMMEQTLKRLKSPMFLFLDHNVLSVQYIYYRWRTYAYLQSDGDRKYNMDAFSMLTDGTHWYPPYPLITIPRGILSYPKRKYYSKYLTSLSRKKNQIEEGMVFALHNINCATDISIMITLEIMQKLKQDFIKYFYLISDILFNTTTQHYRRLFARIIPFIIHKYSKLKANYEERSRITSSNQVHTGESLVKASLQVKYWSQLKSLIQIWQLKFIFDQSYTKGLSYLLNRNDKNEETEVKCIHNKLRQIGCIENDDESELQLEKLCFANGIPFIENDKEESTKLINEYLWLFTKDQEKVPEYNQSFDGQKITEKDLLKIKNKQVKVICSENLPLNILLQKNWQTKNNVGHSGSVDNE